MSSDRAGLGVVPLLPLLLLGDPGLEVAISYVGSAISVTYGARPGVRTAVL